MSGTPWPRLGLALCLSLVLNLILLSLILALPDWVSADIDVEIPVRHIEHVDFDEERVEQNIKSRTTSTTSTPVPSPPQIESTPLSPPSPPTVTITHIPTPNIRLDAQPVSTVNLPALEPSPSAQVKPVYTGPFEPGDLDQGVSPLYRPLPKVDFKRHMRGKTIRLMLKLLVDVSGKVKQVKIIERTPADFRDFDKVVLKTAKTYRFKPGTKAGLAVESWVYQPLKFQ